MLKSESRFDHIGADRINVKSYNNPASGSLEVYLRKHSGKPPDHQGIAAIEFVFVRFFNDVCHNQKL